MNKHTPDRQPPITDEDLREAVARADAGGPFVSADKVHEWMRSLDKDKNAPFPKADIFKTPKS